MNNIEKIQKIIDDNNNIVFFGGAGVSTESGIKDFRGKNGLYKNKKYNYSPEYMLSSSCLHDSPELFFDYYRKNFNCFTAKPNVVHQYLKELETIGKLKAIITQNIDGLHQKAGSKNVLEIHGSIYRTYCETCNKEYSADYIFTTKGIPFCECGGIIRPDVVLYGETLPEEYALALNYIAESDVLIVGGTSLTVEPASSMIRLFKGKYLIIINQTKTPYDTLADLVIHQPLGEVFDRLKVQD